MKRIALILFLILNSFVISAQPKNILVYGSADLAKRTDWNSLPGTGTRTNTWYAKLGIGYTLNKHFTAGVQGIYGKTILRATEEFSTGTMAYPKTNYITLGSAGGFCRYTYALNRAVVLYGQLDIDYFSANNSMNSFLQLGPAKDNYLAFDGQGLVFGFLPGLSINVWKGLFVDLNLGGVTYFHLKRRQRNYINDDFNLSMGHEIGIGISKHFGDFSHSRKASNASKS